jgi:hypothetical protein
MATDEEIRSRYAKAESLWPNLPEPSDALDEIVFGMLRAYADALDDSFLVMLYGENPTEEQRAEWKAGIAAKEAEGRPA